MKAKYPGICARSEKKFAAGTPIRRCGGYNSACGWEIIPLGEKKRARKPKSTRHFVEQEPVPSREVLEQLTFRRGHDGNPHVLSTTIYATLMDLADEFHVRIGRTGGSAILPENEVDWALRKIEIENFLALWNEPSQINWSNNNTAWQSFPHARHCGFFCRDNVPLDMREEIETILAPLIEIENKCCNICIDLWRRGIRPDDPGLSNGREVAYLATFSGAWLPPEAIWPAIGMAVCWLRYDQIASNFISTNIEEIIDIVSNPLGLPENLL